MAFKDGGLLEFAPDAKLVSLRVDGLMDGKKAYGIGLGDAIRYAADNKIPILSMSIGRDNPDQVVKSAQDNIQYYHDKTKGLIVNSAGNSSKPNPDNYTDMTDANKESLLFVVGLGSSLSEFRIVGYSSKCGVAKERCVSVISSNITNNVNGEIVAFAGTSSAAPVVAESSRRA